MSEAHVSAFEQIRHFNEQNNEYWSARELGQVLGYTEYGKFRNTITKAETACKKSGESVEDHFSHVSEMVKIGSGAKRRVNNVRLSRYAAYLVVQNADPEKEIVALGQTYFAVQTRRQELAELALSGEDYKRLAYRKVLDEHILQLAEQAALAGVVTADDFAIFEDFGYLGLYGGLTAEDIRQLKNLAKGQDIKDFMGSEELADNIFRASHTRAKLVRDNVRDKDTANLTHYQIGEIARRAIAEMEGTLPEDLPRPGVSVQQLREREQRKKLLEGQS